MRYTLTGTGYVQSVSFGADVTCDGATCMEYTGPVPSGYSDLLDWFTREGEHLYRWRVDGGILLLDSSVAEPELPPSGNPPLLPGIEYLTTEVFMGLPVYKKVISFGRQAGATGFSLPHDISGLKHPIDCKVFSEDGIITGSGATVQFDSSMVDVLLASNAPALGDVMVYAILTYTIETGENA